jgi:hypothetical protein
MNLLDASYNGSAGLALIGLILLSSKNRYVSGVGALMLIPAATYGAIIIMLLAILAANVLIVDPGLELLEYIKNII